ncbi:hypothetical protein JL101_020825 [Skermanella rosea]|uniref:NnrU family protein n=1 Tax=Skermanella rosea TaxID=1817965 RepID=UPI0019334C85|nr:NnrU family protein [Skermanella rosea]UEM02418.1 hypothetical protein JL101_020825 [Skermanella rosea]
METLILATLFLVGSHVVPGLPGMRSSLIEALGRRMFLAVYSIVSLAALVLLVWSYRTADAGTWLYLPSVEARTLAVLAMPVALFLLVGRLTTPAGSPEPVGIYRITAVPGSLSVLLWTLLHLAVLGGTRQVIVFAGMAAIALFSLVRNWQAASPARRRAGILPFSGMIRGREKLVWNEIGWGRLLLALAVWAALLLLHPVVIGPDPLAYLL